MLRGRHSCAISLLPTSSSTPPLRGTSHPPRATDFFPYFPYTLPPIPFLFCRFPNSYRKNWGGTPRPVFPFTEGSVEGHPLACPTFPFRNLAQLFPITSHDARTTGHEPQVTNHGSRSPGVAETYETTLSLVVHTPLCTKRPPNSGYCL
jgi:hypothetical protein